MDTNRISTLGQLPDESLKRCPLCGSDKFHLVHDKGALYGDMERIVNVYTNLCHGCGVLFNNPRLSESALSRFYREELGQHHGNQTVESIAGQKAKGVSISRIEMMEPFIKGNVRLLEIGGGAMNFAVAFARKYPTSEITELEPSLPGDMRVMRNLHAVAGFVDEVSFSKLNPLYDIVCSFHVLEHQNDPLSFLGRIRTLIKDSGMLFLEVPYPFAPFWSRKPIHGSFRTVHQFNFTRSSMEYLLKKAGYERLQWDMSSVTSLRVACRKGEPQEQLMPLSAENLKRIDSFLFAWKQYSWLVEKHGWSLLAKPFAGLVWRAQTGINRM